MNSQTEKLRLAGPAGVIEVLRDLPAAGVPARGVAVIAHPHPLFGGTMDNKVVQTLARAFVSTGWTAVRFNFRGVGASEGVHDEGRGETEDYRAIVAQLAPEGAIAVAGFSFGAFVAINALQALWSERDVRQVALIGASVAARAWRGRRHGRAGGAHGLGTATVTSCHSRSGGRSFLSRTIAAPQEPRRPPSSRGLVLPVFPHPP
jgi:alpha/beta superfamily hydrolase